MIKIDLPNTLIITNNYFDRLNDVSAKINITILNEIIISIIETINNNKTIYTLGNGGSSSNASHFIIDLIKMGNSINKKIKTFCISDNIPTITAISNDISYDDIFSFQLSQFVSKYDLVFIFSGSGNSKNVINAANTAKNEGAKVVSFTGFDGGDLAKISNLNLHIPINDMQIVEDLHMSVLHIIYKIIHNNGC